MDDAIPPFDYLSFVSSLSICLTFAVVYVLGLYVLSPSSNRYERNHPHVIRRRFYAVFVVCSLIYIYLWNTRDPKVNINAWLGFRTINEISSIWILIFYPIGLTLMLYFGPIVQWIDMSHWRYYKGYWKYCWSEWNTCDRLIFLRNYLVAPFTEEFVFRSSMLCLLYPHVSVLSAIFISPLFFGLAHLHHMLEHFNLNYQENYNRLSPMKIILTHLFQFSYTYIFGVYSSFLFIRTGHFIPPFLVHALCNSLGVPDLGNLIHMDNGRLKQYFFSICYLIGVWLFYSNILLLTQPKIYYSNESTIVVYRNWSPQL